MKRGCALSEQRRPVRMISPVAGFTLSRSPLSNQPNLSIDFSVASGFLLYPIITCGPLATRTPISPLDRADRSAALGLSSGSTMRSSVSLVACPTLPAAIRLESALLWAMRGEHSVRPYPTTMSMPHSSYRNDRRGIFGNATVGADSIVVSRQSSAMREGDGLSWLYYTTTSRQGGGALQTSR